MAGGIVKVDARGRVLISSAVRKSGLDPAPAYLTTVAEDGTITLEPVTTRRLVES